MRARLDFDPRLPQLSLIDDRAAVADLLAPGDPVRDLRRLDTKYEAGTRCIAAYEIRREDPLPSMLGAVDVTPDRVTAYPLEKDPALPHVAEALDGAGIAERRAFPGETTRPRTCRARPVRYKPGVRCVIRYELSGPGGTTTHFGKMLASGSGGEARLVDELRRGLGAVPGAPVVPPVAEWADLGMLVQPAITGAHEVHRVVGDRTSPMSTRRALLHRVGTGLAALHSCPLPAAPGRTFADDLAELRDYHASVSCVDRSLGERFRDLVDELGAVGSDPARAAVTSHGAFRTDQMMDTGRDLVVIDLDTVCRSEPARDIGNLLAYLDWKAIRGTDDSADLAQLGAGFLEGYAERLPLPPFGLLATHRAASLVKIAGRRVRSLTVAEWPMLPLLLDAAGRMVRVREMEPS